MPAWPSTSRQFFVTCADGYAAAAARALCEVGQAIAGSSKPGRFAIACACCWPQAPKPISPKRIPIRSANQRRITRTNNFASSENGMHVEAAVDAFQRCSTRISECESAESASQRINEIRCENFATKRQRADASCDRNGSAVEVVVVLDRLAGMQSGTNSYGKSGETLGDPVAHRQSRAQRERGRRKCKHEAIALRFHDEPAVLLGGVANDAVVPAEHAEELGVAKPLEQHRRRFDVAEHDSHSAVRR